MQVTIGDGNKPITMSVKPEKFESGHYYETYKGVSYGFLNPAFLPEDIIDLTTRGQ